MKLIPPPGPHFSAAELLRIRSEVGPLSCETELRLIHHLALLCPECWAVVWELPPLANGELVVAEPVVRALRRLGMPSELLFDLAPDHLAAIADACRTPLGFCLLLLEEAWLVVQRWPRDLPDLLYAAFGPIGGNGACLLAPREAHDLQARFCSLLATACSQVGQTDRAERALFLARAHLESGTGRQVFSPQAEEGTGSPDLLTYTGYVSVRFARRVHGAEGGPREITGDVGGGGPERFPAASCPGHCGSRRFPGA